VVALGALASALIRQPARVAQTVADDAALAEAA
jgi:hypothetical protein